MRPRPNGAARTTKVATAHGTTTEVAMKVARGAGAVSPFVPDGTQWHRWRTHPGSCR